MVDADAQHADDGGICGGRTAAQAPSRPFFDAPRLDVKRCWRATFAICVGLTVWVGFWDLIDYHLFPLAFRVANGTQSLCEAAEAEPGPMQLVRSPACIVLKLTLFLVGVVGMWATRSLYGTTQVHTAQFSRIR